MNLKQYRLNDWGWIDYYTERYGAEAFHLYKDKIFSMLAQLKPGKRYDLSNVEKKKSKIFEVEYEKDGQVCTESNPELFIKICCTFILSFPDYSFSEDYQKIIRS